jgi:hypothetical protein
MGRFLILMVITCLLLSKVAGADDRTLTATEKDFEQRLNVQMVEVTAAKWRIEAIKAENEARTARAKAEWRIQESRHQGMCEAAAIIIPHAHKKFCN